MDRVVHSFLEGYHAVLEEERSAAIATRLEALDAEMRGFAYEGSGLALRVLDLLTPWRRRRFRTFLAGPGRGHAYMMHVGAGLGLGRFPLPVEVVLRPLDPVFRWAAVDGYGFYEGFARLALRIEEHRIPRRLKGYARRAFDLGLGRSLWFSQGADVDRVMAVIASFPAPRHADLWSGVGLACSYTGWVDRPVVEDLVRAAARFRPQLAQGATLSARARHHAGNPTSYTEMACQVLCGCSAVEAAAVADRALEESVTEGSETAFEVWRQKIQAHFASAFAGAGNLGERASRHSARLIPS